MLPFALKVVWFSLSVSGIAACWIALIQFGRAAQWTLGPVAYASGATLLNVAFALGMIWRMDPFLMPPAFCKVQTFVISFASFFLTGTCAVCSYVTTRIVIMYSKGKTVPPSEFLRWRNIYTLPLLLFPAVASAVQIVFSLYYHAIQPTDDLHCDATSPVEFRFLGYAGIPHLLTLPCFYYSLVSIFRFARTRHHIQRSLANRSGSSSSNRLGIKNMIKNKIRKGSGSTGSDKDNSKDSDRAKSAGAGARGDRGQVTIATFAAGHPTTVQPVQTTAWNDTYGAYGQEYGFAPPAVTRTLGGGKGYFSQAIETGQSAFLSNSGHGHATVTREVGSGETRAPKRWWNRSKRNGNKPPSISSFSLPTVSFSRSRSGGLSGKETYDDEDDGRDAIFATHSGTRSRNLTIDTTHSIGMQITRTVQTEVHTPNGGTFDHDGIGRPPGAPSHHHDHGCTVTSITAGDNRSQVYFSRSPPSPISSSHGGGLGHDLKAGFPGSPTSVSTDGTAVAGFAFGDKHSSHCEVHELDEEDDDSDVDLDGRARTPTLEHHGGNNPASQIPSSSSPVNASTPSVDSLDTTSSLTWARPHVRGASVEGGCTQDDRGDTTTTSSGARGTQSPPYCRTMSGDWDGRGTFGTILPPRSPSHSQSAFPTEYSRVTFGLASTSTASTTTGLTTTGMGTTSVLSGRGMRAGAVPAMGHRTVLSATSEMDVEMDVGVGGLSESVDGGCDDEEVLGSRSRMLDVMGNSIHRGQTKPKTLKPRQYPHLSPAILRLLVFQIMFALVQLLAAMSTIIDAATHRKTPTPFGTQHIALLLTVWGPVILFRMPVAFFDRALGKLSRCQWTFWKRR